MSALLLLSNVAPAFAIQNIETPPTLVSDKDDYAPGEIAVLTGKGFEPGESIDLTISIDDPETGYHVAEYDWTWDQADSNGSFDATYTIPGEAAFMTLTATAIGLSSGRTATTTFTDNPWGFTPAPTISTSGNMVTVSATVTHVGPLVPNPLQPQEVKATVNGVVYGLSRSGGANVTTATWSTTFSGSYATTYTLTKLDATRGSFANTGSFSISATTGPNPYTAPSITSATNKAFGNVLANSGTDFITTVTPADFSPVVTGGTSGSNQVVFADGTSSSQVTLNADTSSQTLQLKAKDTSTGNESALFDVSVNANVYVQPTNTAPNLSASDVALGEHCTADGTLTATVDVSDFSPTATDPEGDGVSAVTFADGSTSKVLVFSAANPTESLTLKVSDNPSSRNLVDVPGAVPLQSLTTTATVIVSASVEEQPVNAPPTLGLSDYTVPGTYNVVNPNFAFSIDLLTSVLNPQSNDPDGDPVSLSPSPSFSVSVSFNNPSSTVAVSATDDPTGRNEPHCVPLIALSTQATASVKANIEVLENRAPIVSGTDYDAGTFAYNDAAINVNVTPSRFGASATDPDGDAFGDVSVDESTLTFDWPAGNSGNTATVTKTVRLSSTDDPSARNATLVPGSGELPSMTGNHDATVTVHLVRNRAPQITATDLNLGDVVGVLSGGSFTTTATLFDGTNYNPGLNVSATDPDGDPLTVQITHNTVTLTGPGQAEVEVTLTATDDPTERNADLDAKSTSVTVKVKANLVYNSRILAPLSATTVRDVKRGSTVPVKVVFTDANGTEITASNLPDGVLPEAVVVYQSGVSPSPSDALITDAGASNSNGNLFRYTGTPGVDGCWIYNLQTNTSYVVGATYRVSAKMNYGSGASALIAIRK